MDSINNDDHEPIPVTGYHHHHPAPVVGVHVNHYGHHPQSWQGHDGQPLHPQQQHHHYHHNEDSTDAATAAALLADETTNAIIPTLSQFHHHHDDGGAAATAAAAVALQPASPLKRTAEQDVATLHHHEHHNNNNHEAELTAAAAKRQKTYPTKKERQEFTASEKLRILKLMEGSRQSSSSSSAIVDAAQPSYTIKQLREKFGVSKSSLHRWRQQKDRLEIMVQSEGLGNRKRDTKDPLEKIKIGLQKFYNDNLNKLPNEQMIITTPVVQAMACKIREELLAEYDAIVADAAAASAVRENIDGQQQEQQVQPQPNLNEEELDAMRSFKITKQWASRVASSMGWFSQPRRKPTQQQQQQAQLQEHQVTHVDGSVGLGNTAAVAVDTIADPEGATTTTVAVDPMTEEESNAEKAKLNTLAFLSQSHPDYSTTNPKAKKTRKEFTATEKIAIIAEMDPQQTANPLNMAEICEKYSTSKSSVFRWKQQLRAGILTQMVNEEGRGNFKRDVADKLGKVKMRLRDFIESSSCQPEETRIALTGAMLQAKAQEFRDELVAQHDADPSNSKLKEDEVEALRKFKASKGWARKAAARFGWHDVEEQANTYADGTAENAAAEAAAAARAAAEGTVDALIGHTQVVEHTHGVAATAAVPPLPGAAAAAAPTLVTGVNYSVVDPQVTDPMHTHTHEQQQHDHQHVQQQHHHQEIENSAAVNEAMDSVLESVGELAGSYQV
jgi:transposase